MAFNLRIQQAASVISTKTSEITGAEETADSMQTVLSAEKKISGNFISLEGSNS